MKSFGWVVSTETKPTQRRIDADSGHRRLEALKQARTRVGTMDLKIASIAMANTATLLSRNLSDFERVPGLRVEDWLSP